ncbi:MAG: SIMPL domain-containing protein, partial [Desulfuromonadales bacterium]|nr:SIMPL domain-containing protein [Desulfuromonadales bacterium]
SYMVVNTLKIRSSRLELAGKLIAAATEAGANEVGSLHFDLADPRQHRAEAIRQATAQARADAGSLAGAAGVRLVRVLSLHLDQESAQPLPMARFKTAEMAMTDAAPVIAPGEVTVRATVQMVYEVGPEG